MDLISQQHVKDIVGAAQDVGSKRIGTAERRCHAGGKIVLLRQWKSTILFTHGADRVGCPVRRPSVHILPESLATVRTEALYPMILCADEILLVHDAFKRE